MARPDAHLAARQPSAFNFLTMSDDRYRPTSRRQRLTIVAVTVATVVGLWLLLIYRPGGHPRVIPRFGTEACKPGQTTDCVGGQANVLLLPATPASSPK
ncbi:hypothetical protein [Ideonella margarita]|uniref:Uncharacterized protein n=1 Tax=Ideonella margarita TaxID=2984191 RepID=A0ABU9C7W9_9BURK